ncbi:DUF4304 domain-containing protein [Brevibacillus dissolubilis]|uniref:DUF4304 domain-containing protein n=1 Tax=Brevibacillus dissolubilis TaxID=1844116 RepID=UPI00159B87FE|nr:DUF4304 domain-containing protein [Brevibacillus dissolubilis]
MADPFQFSKHLGAIVGAELKPLGFRKKGTRFSRRCGDITEEIFFQRSQWNLPGSPFQFYLNIGVKDETGRLGYLMDERIAPPYKLPKPDFYAALLEIPADSPDYLVVLNRLTPQQQAEIDRFDLSLQWHYSTEEELQKLFVLALLEIKAKAFPYWERIAAAVHIEEPEQAKREIRKLRSLLNS